jgi:hypothetical protein
VKFNRLGIALLSCLMCVGIARAQDRPDQQTPKPDQPAPQQDETSSPSRKWPPFGIALGVALREVVPAGDSTSTYTTATPLVRFIPRNHRKGLVPALRLGLGQQPTTLVDAGSGQTAGSVHLRPLMLGAGWSQPVGQRLTLVFTGTAGYSWNGVDATDNGHGSPRLLVPSTVVGVGNSSAWELSGRAWFDVTPRVGVLVGTNFLLTRPNLRLATGTTLPWSANQVRIDVGVAFTVLKPLVRH